MMQDGLFDSYTEGLSQNAAKQQLSRMVAQVVHRYPHANVLEIGKNRNDPRPPFVLRCHDTNVMGTCIGAGKGESTSHVLNALASAFSSYTYTDASPDVFEAAQERFRQYSSRMIFRTYDTEQPPASQDFTEGYYDVVFASNVLHATAQPEEVMANIRRLLKPGGYLITLELNSNDNFRVGLSMGSLPGWWVGANAGRTHGLGLSLPEWDALLLRSGFGGIDTNTPMHHRLEPYTVFAAQAVDERINLLRSPLASAPEEGRLPHLIILGGQTLAVQRIIRDLKGLLRGRFEKIDVVGAVENLDAETMMDGSAILSVTELDEPLFEIISPAKLEGLKKLWRQAGTVLWVTRRARTEEPLSFMTHGLCRVVKYEYPNVSLQVLDLDVVDAKTPELLAEEFIRAEALKRWGKEAIPGAGVLWSAEPEVSVESGKRLIPRLYKFVEANDRYNSARRTLIKSVDPQNTAVVLASAGDGQSYDLRCPSPLRLLPHPPSICSTITVCVSHILLQTIKLSCSGRVFLCAGVEEATGNPLLALSHTAESRPTVPADWTIPLSNADPAKAIAAVAAHMVSSTILHLAQTGSAILVHEPDDLVAAALVRQAAKAQITVVTTTSSSASRNGISDTWHYVHSKLSTRLVEKVLPRQLSVFVDLSQAPGSAPAGRLIAKCLPPMCSSFSATDFYGTTAEIPAWLSPESVASTLADAWRDVQDNLGEVDAPPILPLQDVPSQSVFGSPLQVADWSATPVSVRVEAIDEGVIFRADRTYWLVGMAGDLGQGLCRWMVERGAKYVVLSSRRPKPLHPGFVAFLQGMGATVNVLPLDVTSRDSVFECHRQIVKTMPAVAGLAMGAMVLEDSLFDRLSFEVLTKVLEPKLTGTRNLDALFYNDPLDFFVVFSSLVAVTGNSGQSNYVCANMFMTALALHRKRRGLAGSAVALGSVMGVGFVERTEKLTSDYFIKLGTRNISEQDVQQQFAEAIRVGHPDCRETAEIATGLVPIYADTHAKAQFRDDVKFGHFVMQRAHANDRSGRPRFTLPVRVQLPEVKSRSEAMEVIKGQWAQATFEPPQHYLLFRLRQQRLTLFNAYSILHIPAQADLDDRAGRCCS